MKTALVILISLCSFLSSAQDVTTRKSIIIKKIIDTVLNEEKLHVDTFNTVVLIDLATQRLNFSNGPFGDKVQVSDWYNDTGILKKLKDVYSNQLKDSILFLYSRNDWRDFHKTSLIYTFTFPKRNSNRMYIEIGSPICGWGFIDLYLDYWAYLKRGENYFDYVKFDADRIIIPCIIYYKRGNNKIHKEYLVKLKAIETPSNNIDFILSNIQVL